MTSEPEPRPAPGSPPHGAIRLARRRLIAVALLSTISMIWVFIAARFYLDPAPGGVPPYLWGVLGAVSLVNAFAHGLAAWFVQRGSRWGHLYAVVLVSVNLVFTLTDQMGPADWIMLGLSAVTLGLLVWTRPRKPVAA